MEFTARRLTSLILGGGLVVALSSGCGAIGAAVDCATIADTMSEVATNVNSDVETLKASTTQLRDEAADIADEGVKQAALDFADQAESINAGLNGDIAEGAQTDPSALQGAIDDFTDKCNALG